MKILYIGTSATYHLYKEGKNPSHWLYGAVEMEKDGHQVVWEQERASFLNDYRLVKKHKPELVFIPNLNLRHHVFLLFLKRIGMYRKPILAFLHHTPKQGKTRFVYSFLLKALTHCFFLSQRTMDETVRGGYIHESKCSHPGWGADMDFYDRIDKEDGGYFISTGKENRDFDLLIEVFKETKAPLKIMTARSHAGSDYKDLKEKCATIPNIEVIITENSGNVYPMMAGEMARAKAIVCPLRQDRLDYCVGLSTIADAEGLGKPLILTRNPYHDSQRTARFNVVRTKADWKEAILHLKDSGNAVEYSMKNCYQKMKPYISK